jgi:hypothetical protein
LVAKQAGVGAIRRGGSMDLAAQLDELQRHITEARSAVEAAASEPPDQRRQRIDQAQADTDQTARRQAPEAAAGEQEPSKWAQLKADAAAKRDDVKAKVDQRTRQMDADAAANEADWVETDATDAVDYAMWTVDNARLSVLDAIDARAYANELARAAGS